MQDHTRRLLRRLVRGLILGLAFYGAYFLALQWWLTSDLRFVRNARIASEPCATGTSAPYGEEGQNEKLSQFFHFAGVEPGTTIEQVRDLYGSPESESRHPTTLGYLNSAVEFVFYEDTVSRVRLSNRFALRGGAGVEEPLGAYLGQPASAFLADFGLPHRFHAGLFRYRFSGPGRTGEVEFTCYEFQGCRCSTIEVAWRVL